MHGPIQIIKTALYDFANKTFINVSCLKLSNNTHDMETRYNNVQRNL